ncbi:flavodoxin [Agrilactobacillus yilanensis]|uniref:Flavodoxin n=1 Tax=Agrilactobacillus yilanensis TaxID=2485997 RepID=A0ABW4J7J3_9LACO|nr:flavodoxin [Agrilactobacillus yilanensis]
MKKNVLALIIIVILIVLGGSYYFINRGSSNAANSQSPSQSGSSSTVGAISKRSKTLILYYSNSGTTRTAAKEIQKQTGADLIEMKISSNYPSDYNKLIKVAKREIDNNARPKITNKIDVSKYDTIFIGFPTWYHRPPMFINTFFEIYNLKGKTIVPFTTSMSSSMSESTPYLKRMAKGTGVTLQTGFRANETSTITKYLKNHDLAK